MKAGWLVGILLCASALCGAAQPLQLEAIDGTPVAVELPALEAGAKAGVDLKPNQIGISRRVDLEALPAIGQDSLQWVSTGQGVAARIHVSSPGAEGLRVGLRFAALPPGLELVVAQRSPEGTLTVVSTTTSFEIAKLSNGAWPVEHWTATTEGAEQVIELRSGHPLEPGSLRFKLFDVSHLLQKAAEPIRPKALEFTCHVDVACVANSDVHTDSRAVARMVFTDGGSTFLCTGSLLNDRVTSLTPLFATANHCIHSQASASSLETWWFNYPATCGGAPAPGTRVTGGGTLLFADFDTDFALLRLARNAPTGAFFLGWDQAPLPVGEAIFGLHHPDGSFQRYSSGLFQGFQRIRDSATNAAFAQPFARVLFTQGIIEGGSSGSPLLTAPGSFRGTLFGSPDSNSCTSTNNSAFYSDFSAVYPMIAGFLAGPNAGDDHGDSPANATAINTSTQFVAEINNTSDEDWFRVVFTAAGVWTVSSFSSSPSTSVDVRGDIYLANGTTLIASNDDSAVGDVNFSMTIAVSSPTTLYLRVRGGPGVVGHYGIRATFALPDEYGDTPAAATPLGSNATASGVLGSTTDQDWFRLTFSGPGVFQVRSTGFTDTIGRLYRADGTTLVAENDDEHEDSGDTNFGIATTVTAATTLYLQVTGWEGSTGPYGLATTFSAGLPNYTDLWWNPNESGWGVTVNHQSDTLFAALFTYDTGGRDMWLFASGLARQADGTFTGPLYRSVGPSFNANPWTAINLTQVGTMTFSFSGASQGTLSYTVNGATVTKAIQRQVFGTPPTCTFTSASRTGATNYQDLWWNPAESGWGVSLAHQGSLIFAALFTYAADNKDMWLFASGLARQPNGSFTGPLYRATGPVFNANPWAPPIMFTPVGTMTLSFANGAAGTLSYTVDGASVTKSIERQVFGTLLTVCQ